VSLFSTFTIYCIGLLHCVLASWGAVYCNRSCLWYSGCVCVCSGRVGGGRCPLRLYLEISYIILY